MWKKKVTYVFLFWKLQTAVVIENIIDIHQSNHFHQEAPSSFGPICSICTCLTLQTDLLARWFGGIHSSFGGIHSSLGDLLFFWGGIHSSLGGTHSSLGNLLFLGANIHSFSGKKLSGPFTLLGGVGFTLLGGDLLITLQSWNHLAFVISFGRLIGSKYY